MSSGPETLATARRRSTRASDEAQKILRKKGFQPTVQNQSSSSVEKGLVISTNPAAGIEVQHGSPVTVYVSSGPQEASVPEVTGESQAAATAALAAAGLKETVVKREVAEPTPGTVISQSPAAGSSLEVGGQVTIVVAQALKQAAVPSLVGQSEAQAVATLTAADFTSHTVQRTVTEPSKVGTVVQQSPAAGHKLSKGGEVTIAVGVLAQQTTSTSTTHHYDTPTTPHAAPAAGTPPATDRPCSVPGLGAAPLDGSRRATVTRGPRLLEQSDLRDLRGFVVRWQCDDPDQVVAVDQRAGLIAIVVRALILRAGASCFQPSAVRLLAAASGPGVEAGDEPARRRIRRLRRTWGGRLDLDRACGHARGSRRARRPGLACRGCLRCSARCSTRCEIAVDDARHVFGVFWPGAERVVGAGRFLFEHDRRDAARSSARPAPRRCRCACGPPARRARARRSPRATASEIAQRAGWRSAPRQQASGRRVQGAQHGGHLARGLSGAGRLDRQRLLHVGDHGRHVCGSAARGPWRWRVRPQPRSRRRPRAAPAARLGPPRARASSPPPPARSL